MHKGFITDFTQAQLLFQKACDDRAALEEFYSSLRSIMDLNLVAQDLADRGSSDQIAYFDEMPPLTDASVILPSGVLCTLRTHDETSVGGSTTTRSHFLKVAGVETKLAEFTYDNATGFINWYGTKVTDLGSALATKAQVLATTSKQDLKAEMEKWYPNGITFAILADDFKQLMGQCDFTEAACSCFLDNVDSKLSDVITTVSNKSDYARIFFGRVGSMFSSILAAGGGVVEAIESIVSGLYEATTDAYDQDNLTNWEVTLHETSNNPVVVLKEVASTVLSLVGTVLLAAGGIVAKIIGGVMVGVSFILQAIGKATGVSPTIDLLAKDSHYCDPIFDKQNCWIYFNPLERNQYLDYALTHGSATFLLPCCSVFIWNVTYYPGSDDPDAPEDAAYKAHIRIYPRADCFGSSYSIKPSGWDASNNKSGSIYLALHGTHQNTNAYYYHRLNFSFHKPTNPMDNVSIQINYSRRTNSTKFNVTDAGQPVANSGTDESCAPGSIHVALCSEPGGYYNYSGEALGACESYQDKYYDRYVAELKRLAGSSGDGFGLVTEGLYNSLLSLIFILSPLELSNSINMTNEYPATGTADRLLYNFLCDADKNWSSLTTIIGQFQTHYNSRDVGTYIMQYIEASCKSGTGIYLPGIPRQYQQEQSLIPPERSVSSVVLAAIIVVSLVAAIAITAAVTKRIVHRKMAVRADVRRSQLRARYQQALNNGDLATMEKIRASNDRWNMLYSLFGVGSFDLSNGWVNDSRGILSMSGNSIIGGSLDRTTEAVSGNTQAVNTVKGIVEGSATTLGTVDTAVKTLLTDLDGRR